MFSDSPRVDDEPHIGSLPQGNRCPNCDSENYIITESKELCPDCGNHRDYSTGGPDKKKKKGKDN